MKEKSANKESANVLNLKNNREEEKKNYRELKDSKNFKSKWNKKSSNSKLNMGQRKERSQIIGHLLLQWKAMVTLVRGIALLRLKMT